MNGLWIIGGIAVLLLCAVGLAFDRDRRHRTRGVHRTTRVAHRVNYRVGKLEQRVDQQDERIDVNGLIAQTAHERLDVLDVPMTSPPTDGSPGYADTVVLPVGRPRRSWWTTSSTAAGIVLTIVGFVGAMLMVLQAKPTADRQHEPIPPRPPSPRPVDPPPSDAPAPPTEDIPDWPDQVVVGPATTVTVTVTAPAVEMLGPSMPTRQAPATGAPMEATGPPTTTTPPVGPADTDGTPCPTPLPVPPPAGCVITPQLGP